MKTLYLQINLLSDAAFGRGDGVAGAIDSEVQHDALGCPYLNGKEIKGILAQECAAILASLPVIKRKRWYTSAQRLFGQAGSTIDELAWLAVGDARLPEDLTARLEWERAKILKDLEQYKWENLEQRKKQAENYFRIQTLEMLTAVRQQTALDEITGVAKDHSLRTKRVVIRKTPLTAKLDYQPRGNFASESLTEYEKVDFSLLAACTAAFRRAGAGRNRGLGSLVAELQDTGRASVQKTYLQAFLQEVRE